jgi:probable HAF family extracellular repeat protein
MKSRTLTCITAMTLFAALAIPAQLAAQEEKDKKRLRYTVADIGTLGGTFGEANAVNNKGWVVGDANLPGDTVRHAFLWRKGLIKDLMTLGGPNSIAFSLNERGEVTGYSDTSTPDPLGEDFCLFNSNQVCLPFLWQHGAMTPLPTLGGNNGQAFSTNSRGQVAGVAENNKPDPTCVATRQVLHFKPVLWEEGEIQELPTIAGDTDGSANAINDEGQAVGVTGDCTRTFHGVLWEHGTVTDLGTLGGLVLSPLDINNRGQVVGLAFSPDFTTIVAFLWQNGVATNLGTVPPDVFSLALGINDKGQIVGDSCDVSFSCRAFLWQNGTLTDLNSLVHDPTAPYLENGNSINSRGQFAGKTTVQGTPIADAYLSTPSHGEPDSETAPADPRAATSQEPRVVLPENVRKMLLQRRGFGRFVSSPQNVTLSDAAPASRPNVTLSPTSLTFPTQLIGTKSAAKMVTLKNTGTTSLTITNIAITGTNAGDFAQTHTCRRSLAASASCTISVTFKPTASGTRTAALSITDTAPGSPQKVSLSGTGAAGRCLQRGQQCPPQFPPCCPGLVCVPASTRAFCESAAEHTSTPSSSWDQVNANKLQ